AVCAKVWGSAMAAPARSHNQAFSPSGLRIVHQVELAMIFISGMCANVAKNKSPAHRKRRFLTTHTAPLSKVIAATVQRHMTSLVHTLCLSATLCAIDDVMLINHVTRCEWLRTKE